MALAGRFIRIGLVLSILFIDTVVGQVHELVAEALHGRGIPESEEKGRGEMVRQQTDDVQTFPQILRRERTSAQMFSDAQEPQTYVSW